MATRKTAVKTKLLDPADVKQPDHPLTDRERAVELVRDQVRELITEIACQAAEHCSGHNFDSGTKDMSVGVWWRFKRQRDIDNDLCDAVMEDPLVKNALEELRDTIASELGGLLGEVATFVLPEEEGHG